MKLSSIVLFLSISVLFLFFIFYQFYDNAVTHEEELRLSVHYLENVTKIDSAVINLDFNKKQMEYSSKFYVNGTGLMLGSNSRGFEQNDANCDGFSCI